MTENQVMYKVMWVFRCTHHPQQSSKVSEVRFYLNKYDLSLIKSQLFVMVVTHIKTQTKNNVFYVSMAHDTVVKFSHMHLKYLEAVLHHICYFLSIGVGRFFIVFI